MQKIEEINYNLISKYDVRGPRYTSYPTYPEWVDPFPEDKIKEIYQKNNCPPLRPVSVYVHIPFCEELCWFCACNTKITKNRSLARDYLKNLKLETELIFKNFNPERKAVQFHWGGGTPTYLNPEQIETVFQLIKKWIDFTPEAEISMEVDPRVTDFQQLKIMRELGFTRLSMGVQDFDSKVQEAVHRNQTFEQTANLVVEARRIGFKSVNIDLMYGLPLQTLDSFQETLEKVKKIKPDRIALFSYAHVPWIKKTQKSFERLPLPLGENKFNLFKCAIEKLVSQGYKYIGMDHFAFPEDELVLAQNQGTLQRNFMGYTTHGGTDLYGFGVSAISEIDHYFLQNQKDLTAYYQHLKAGNFPTFKNLKLSKDDVLRKEIIQLLTCQLSLDIPKFEQKFQIDFESYFQKELIELGKMEGELLTLEKGKIKVLPYGQLLIRNICMIWDAHLQKTQGEERKFSRTI